jgi:hypothetical protein
MYCAADKLPGHHGDSNLSCTTAFNVNPTPLTREEPEGGTNVTTSLQNAGKLIKHAE